jgi:hypothetical protein
MQLCRSSGSAVHQPRGGHKALSRNSFEIEWPEYLSQLEMNSMKMRALPVNSAIVAFTLGADAPAGNVRPALTSAPKAPCAPRSSADHAVGGAIPRGQCACTGCMGSKESGFGQVGGKIPQHAISFLLNPSQRPAPREAAGSVALARIPETGISAISVAIPGLNRKKPRRWGSNARRDSLW